jgi:ribonuclease HI
MFLDSELIVKQLNGQYKVKDSKMRSLYTKVIKSLDGIEWTVTHVKRHLNKEADALVNKALDEL